jgi:hypothetical protein
MPACVVSWCEDFRASRAGGDAQGAPFVPRTRSMSQLGIEPSNVTIAVGIKKVIGLARVETADRGGQQHLHQPH